LRTEVTACKWKVMELINWVIKLNNIDFHYLKIIRNISIFRTFLQSSYYALRPVSASRMVTFVGGDRKVNLRIEGCYISQAHSYDWECVAKQQQKINK
jgi:hypothetical protein